MALILQFPPVEPGSMRQLAVEIRKDLYGGGPVADDARLSIRQIEMLIKRIYDSVITQMDKADFKGGRLPDPSRLMPFKCYSMRDTDEISCGCSKFSWGLKKVKLPKLYLWRGKPYITYFGSSDLQTNWVRVNSLVELNSIWKLVGIPAYLIMGNIAYVILPPQYALLCDVTFWGIPQDPTYTEGSLCFDVWSQDWAVPGHIKEIIKDTIIGKWGQTVLSTKGEADMANNSADIAQRTPKT